MIDTETRERRATATVPRTAAMWINGRRALVALLAPDGRITTREIARGFDLEPAYLARVVRAVGDRERVLILGPGSARLALEREYVTIYRRPDRLVDVEPADVVDTAGLVERLSSFAA